jgi:hypothetical protein
MKSVLYEGLAIMVSLGLGLTADTYGPEKILWVVGIFLWLGSVIFLLGKDERLLG